MTEIRTASVLKQDPNKIQTYRRFKRTPFIRTKQSKQMFGLIPFVKLQNDLKNPLKQLVLVDWA